MKKQLQKSLLILCLGAFCTISCQKEKLDEGTTSLVPVEFNNVFTAVTTERVLEFSSDSNWTMTLFSADDSGVVIDGVPSWITADVVSGEPTAKTSINFSVDANPTSTVRKAVLHLENSSMERYFNISQGMMPSGELVSVNVAKDIDLTYKGSKFMITVKSNITPVLAVSVDKNLRADLLKYEFKTEDKTEFKTYTAEVDIKQNTENEEVIGGVKLLFTDPLTGYTVLRDVLAYTQEQNDVIATQEKSFASYMLDAKGGKISHSVKANFVGSLVIPSEFSWITATPAPATKGKEDLVNKSFVANVTIAPSTVARIGYFEIKHGATSVTTKVYVAQSTATELAFFQTDRDLETIMGKEAFNLYIFKEATKAVLGGTVDFAFVKENLKKVKTIDLSTMTSKAIPSVTSGDASYFASSNILEIILPTNDKLETIGDYSFYGFDGIVTGIDSQKSLKSIGAYAFAYAKLSSNLVIADNVISIGDNAFLNVDIEELTLGKALKTIGAYSFLNKGVDEMKVIANPAKTVISIKESTFQEGTVVLTVAKGLKKSYDNNKYWTKVTKSIIELK